MFFLLTETKKYIGKFKIKDGSKNYLPDSSAYLVWLMKLGKRVFSGLEGIAQLSFPILISVTPERFGFKKIPANFTSYPGKADFSEIKSSKGVNTVKNTNSLKIFFYISYHENI